MVRAVKGMKRSLFKQETGSIRKDWGGRISIALVYPNIYRVGISNLGFQILYQLLNQLEDVVCERVFLPGPGSKTGRVRSVESERILQDFELVAVSVPYENDFLNICRMLESSKIPSLSQERDDNYPILIGGGLALTMNPEPMAEVFDLIFIGEGRNQSLRHWKYTG